MLYEEGQHFKKDSIVAKNDKFFLGNKQEDITFANGYLAKVACACGDYTLEDSSIISEEISEAMSCDVTMMIDANLGVNTNVLSIKKKGQHIKTGESLITFEHSFENAEANSLLDSLGDDGADYIENLGVDNITSKYTGEIVDVKVYYNRDLDDFTDSMKKVITDYTNSVKKRKAILDKNGDINTVLPSTDKIDNEKINGKAADGVVIEFYIRHSDLLQTGSKIVYGTAIKTVVSDVIPKGEEPYSEREPDEPIGCIYTPLSVISRMTVDSYSMLFTNKLIIEMKKQMKQIWNS